MKITLIGLSNTEVNIFPELGEALAKKISSVEISERFAPVADDLPVVALEETEDSDFLIVFAPIDDEELSDFVKRKLVDVELSTKTRILKLVGDENYFSGDEYELSDEKEVLVSKIVEMVVNILFNERAFVPKEKEIE